MYMTTLFNLLNIIRLVSHQYETGEGNISIFKLYTIIRCYTVFHYNREIMTNGQESLNIYLVRSGETQIQCSESTEYFPYVKSRNFFLQIKASPVRLERTGTGVFMSSRNQSQLYQSDYVYGVHRSSFYLCSLFRLFIMLISILYQTN